MRRSNREMVRMAVRSQMGQLTSFLDKELGITAGKTNEEIKKDLVRLGLDPSQPVPAQIRQLTSEILSGSQWLCPSDPDGARSGRADFCRLVVPRHAYANSDPLQNECGDEVKVLILETRHLSKQQRYEEALDLAIKATRIEPEYWRARITLGVLLVVLDQIDDGEKIFAEVLNNPGGNPQTIGAALHCRAWVKETRWELNPPADILQEVSREYENALKWNPSSANTRASLLICRLLSEGASNNMKLLGESLLREGFLDALKFELGVRTANAWKVLQMLPGRVGNLIGSNADGQVYPLAETL